jgi:peptidoglycan/LPS O-acetylase OafA/YrhL
VISPDVMAFTAGLLTAGYLISALFFLRFWRRTHDALFGSFTLAFLLMAVTQALPLLLSVPNEQQAWIYLFRLAAFLLIIAAIVRKNLGR